ncbi:MAG: hypothetical protein ACYTBV_10525, partial [Planctomycetota bacterium]
MINYKRIIITALVLCVLVPSVAEGGVSVMGGLTHQKDVQPGSTYSGQIILKNSSSQPQEVKIYQTDYTFCYDGSNKYGKPGEMDRSNANWITFNPHRVVISPNDVTTVSYTVAVPNEPNLIGTYWSMIMVEGIANTSPESSLLDNRKTHLGIRQVVRYGVQMITHIDDTGERQLKFLDTKLLRKQHKRILHVDIENTGQRWLRPVLWVEIYDENGNHIGKFEGQKKRIFPKTSVRYKVDLTDVPNGQYKALVIADGGGDYIFGANYT